MGEDIEGEIGAFFSDGGADPFQDILLEEGSLAFCEVECGTGIGLGEVNGLGLKELCFYFPVGEFGDFGSEVCGIFFEEDGADSREVVALDFGMVEGPSEGFVWGVRGPFVEVFAEVIVLARAVLVGEVEGLAGGSFEEAGDDSAEGADAVPGGEVAGEEGDGEIGVGCADGVENFCVEFGVFRIDLSEGFLGVVAGEGPPVKVLEFGL